MEIHELRQVREVVGYTCDVCHKPCYNEDACQASTELAVLRAEWGFWSRGKDQTVHECHLCESCYDKVRTFIEQTLNGTIRIVEKGN